MAQLTSHLTNCSKESVKSEPNEMESCIPTGMHNDNIKGMSDDKKDDILLESNIPASDREFSEENEITELGSSIKSEVSSPESPYVNLEDDKFTIEETNVQTEESNAELNDASAIIEIPRKRGRSHGTFGKEKRKEIVKALKAMITYTNNVTSQQIPMKRGRPLGSFGRKKRNRVIEALKATMTDANHGAIEQVPRRRGRPRKNRDKITSQTESDALCNREISELIKEAHAKRFTCPECKQAFTSNALLEHFPLHKISDFICVVCHKEFTMNESDFKIHMQQHCTPDNRGRFNCVHCPRSYLHKGGLISHYRKKHPPKRVVNEKECSENCEPTQQIALVKSEPNESDSSITHNKIIINKMAEDNNLRELEKAPYEEFCKENEVTELVSSLKSEPTSPESSYVNLEDDKFTVEEIDVKAEESIAELNNPSSAIIGSSPGTVDHNDPSLQDQDQNQQKKSFKCIECNENYMDAEYTHKRIMSSLSNLQCWVCGECCLSEADLTSHMATHDRTYTCKICSKSFLHLLANEKRITHCSQKHMQHHNGNELFSCEICRKRLTTKTEDELLTCPGKDFCEEQVNGSMDSIKSEPSSPETLKISQKNNSAAFHDFNLPKLDDRKAHSPLSGQEFNVKSELSELVELKNEPSSAENFKSSQKNHTSSSTFHHLDLPKSASVNLNVSVSDMELCDESNELVDLAKTAPSAPASKASQKNQSLSSTFHHLNLPKSDAVNGNMSVCCKELCDESSELEILAKSEQSASEFCKSCQKNSSSATSFQQFILTKSVSDDRIVSTTNKELESSASEFGISCQRHRSSAPPSSADVDNLLLDPCPSKVALRKMTDKADASNALGRAVGPTSKQLGGRIRSDAVTKVGNHKRATNHYNIPDYKGPFRCKLCPVLFARKSNLTGHYRMFHPPKSYIKNDVIIESSSAAARNKLFMKMMITTKTEDELLTCPGKDFCEEQVNGSMDSVKSEPSSPETLKISQKNNSAAFHDFNLPKLDDRKAHSPLSGQEFNVKSELSELVELKNEPSSAEIFKSSQKNHTSSSTFHHLDLPKSASVNLNVSVSDMELCDESNELVDLAKTAPSAPASKASQKNQSLSSTFHHLNLPKSDAVNGNMSVCCKELCDESSELEILAKSEQSASEFCKSCQKNSSSATSFQQFILTKSVSDDRIVSTTNKEHESSASEFCISCQRHRSSAPPSSADLDNLLLDPCPSKVALCKMTDKADASNSLGRAVGPTWKQLGGRIRSDAVTKVGNHKRATNHYNIPDYKGPFRCKLCPVMFARKSNLTGHYRMFHPPKSYIKNDVIIESSSAAARNKLFMKMMQTKKLETPKHHTLPVSNTSGHNVTVSNKKIRELEPSNATVRSNISTLVHKKNLEVPKIKIPESEYYKWIFFRNEEELWEKNKIKEVVVNSAKSEPSSSTSPHYIIQEKEKKNIEENKGNTLEKNEKKIEQTKETKAGYIDSFIQFLATK